MCIVCVSLVAAPSLFLCRPSSLSPSSSVIPLRSSLFCFHLSGFPLLICWSLQVHNQSGSVDWSFGGADLRRRPATPAVSSGEADVSHLYPLFLISVLPSVIALVACAASVRIGLIWFLGLGTIFSGLFHAFLWSHASIAALYFLVICCIVLAVC